MGLACANAISGRDIIAAKSARMSAAANNMRCVVPPSTNERGALDGPSRRRPPGNLGPNENRKTPEEKSVYEVRVCWRSKSAPPNRLLGNRAEFVGSRLRDAGILWRGVRESTGSEGFVSSTIQATCLLVLTTTMSETFLFTSESVNEGHPGRCLPASLLRFVQSFL